MRRLAHLLYAVKIDTLITQNVDRLHHAVPRDRVDDAMSALERADTLLVVGSSLIMFSGFRFARQAAALDKPIAIVDQAVTRADDIAALKVEEDCARSLSDAIAGLNPNSLG